MKISLEREKKAARCDYLTGVYNRQGFFEFLELELYNMKRYGRSLAIAYLDIDDFKKVNDDLGHASGDRLLKNLTALIQKHLRKSDILARLGGDEFIILLPDTNLTKARKVFDKIKKMSGRLMEKNKWKSSISMGVGIFRKWDKKPEDIIHTVDRLMFKIKKSSKNDVRYMEI